MDEEHRQMVEDCVHRESKLTDWERGFIDSLSNRELPLSYNQEERLNEIWERVT